MYVFSAYFCYICRKITKDMEESKMVLRTEDLVKKYGKRTVVSHVSINVKQGEIVGLLGPNGAGKTTSFYMTVGLITPNEGRIFLDDLEITKYPVYKRAQTGIGYLAQEASVFRQMTVEDNIASVLEMTNKPLDYQKDKLESLIAEFRLQKVRKNKGTQLSGGERRRVALCKLLLEAPDLLLLDEPTNHLDAESILWLEQFLHQYKGAVIAVTHDRYFMDNVAEWICEVDRGHLYPYKGNYSTYLETKAKRMEIQGAKDAKLAKRLKSELDWVRSSPKARQAKNKARLERYDQMENEARNNKKLDFSEIQIPAGPRLGSTVLEANHIHKAFGDRVLIDDLSFTLPRNGIVGVIGPNGVGKSTLFKTIVGLEPLTSGELKIGDTVKISYVDQNREGLDPNKNLWEAVSGGLDFIEVAGVEVPTRAYVASFGFKGADQQKLTGVLSGGERNRLNLALTLKQGGNLLLLDEPTNDLDVETLESLENALLEFPGCAVVISHDRWFLDRVATHILAWEGDDDNPAKWYWFEGNFQAYQENKVARLGEDAARPHRLHKKLVRG